MFSVIYVIGPDGVGKTTQARFIEKLLLDKGFPTKYVWIRWNHKFSLPLLLLARLLKITKIVPLRNGQTIGYHYFDKIKPLAILYQYTYLLDSMIAYFIKIQYESWKGKIIVCDRSPRDAIIDLKISIRNTQLINKKIIDIFYSMTKNAIVFMLMASSTVLKKRRENVFYDETISQKIQLYHELTATDTFFIINAERDISVVRDEIEHLITVLI